jgi:hypothetical protein
MTSQRDVESRLLEESELFHAQLPELLKEHAGEIALFKDGRLLATFESFELAFDAGVDRFGLEPFLVERITDGSSEDAQP